MRSVAVVLLCQIPDSSQVSSPAFSRTLFSAYIVASAAKACSANIDPECSGDIAYCFQSDQAMCPALPDSIDAGLATREPCLYKV